MILTTADTVAKVSDENQDESRFLILEIRRTEYDRHKIRVAMQGTPPDIAEDLKVIESVWTVMPKCVINATNNAVTGNTVAFHRLFDAEIPLRDFQRYLAMIRASALLHGRTTTTDDDVVFVANVLSYARHSINSTTAGLTPIERAVQQTLQKEAHVYPVSISQIQGFTNLPVYTVYRALRGKDGSFEHPVGGLLTKDPNVQIGRDLQTHERLIMYGRDGD